MRVVDRDEIATIIDPTLDWISGFVGGFVRRLPDALAVQFIESGAFITGGGATLDLLIRRVEQATGISAVRADDPFRSVIEGARAMIGGGLRPPKPVAA